MRRGSRPVSSGTTAARMGRSYPSTSSLDPSSVKVGAASSPAAGTSPSARKPKTGSSSSSRSYADGTKPLWAGRVGSWNSRRRSTPSSRTPDCRPGTRAQWRGARAHDPAHGAAMSPLEARVALDIRTLALLLGITHSLQLIALALQAAINRSYSGTRWWLLWSASVALGFPFVLIRTLPGAEHVSILAQNGLIVLGTFFLY